MKKFFMGLILVLLLTSCQKTSQIRLKASWPEHYNTVADLKKNSDLVAYGRIASIGQVQQKGPDEGTVFTDYNFDIINILSGAEERKQIVVHQTGGRKHNALVEVENDPLFRVGEQLVLYLKRYVPGRYFVVGGPKGRFEIRSESQVTTHKLQTKK